MNRVKNLVIVFLVVICIIQSGRLWLDDYSSRNFFYSFTNNNALENDAEQYSKIDLLNPSRVVLNYGNNRFFMTYNYEDYKKLKEKTEEALQFLLSIGKFIKRQDYDAVELMSYKSVNYYYNVPLSFSLFSDEAKDKAQFSQGQMTSFDILTIIPTRNTAEQLMIVITDTEKSISTYYSIPKNLSLATAIMTELEAVQPQTESLQYISTLQRGFTLFENNLFLPQWQKDEYVYAPIEITDVMTTNLENSMEYFFGSKAVRFSGKDLNDNFVYNSENTVVKYNTKGVLEYYNYETEEGKDISFADAAVYAFNFITKDVLMKNTFYITKAEKIGKEWHIYCDYAINDMPVVLSPEIKAKLEMDSAIYFIVSDKGVKYYKRYTYQLDLNENDKRSLEESFLTKLNEYMEKDDRLKVLNMTLGYYIEDGNRTGKLQWIIDYKQTEEQTTSDGITVELQSENISDMEITTE